MRGRALEDLFEKELSGTTEFFLYCAYLVTTGQESLYEDSAQMAATLFTKWPREHKDVMRAGQLGKFQQGGDVSGFIAGVFPS